MQSALVLIGTDVTTHTQRENKCKHVISCETMRGKLRVACEACNVAQIVFYEKHFVCIFGTILSSSFFECQKTQKVIWRLITHTSTRELPLWMIQ